MSGQTDWPAAPPYSHCALCPVGSLAGAAALPEIGRLQVYPVAIHSTTPAGTAATAPPPQPPPPSAEAVLIFWSQAPVLEAGLAALDGIRFFDWSEGRYRERRTGRNASDASSQEPLSAPPGGVSAGGVIPQPLLLQFADFPGWVECQPGAGQALWKRLSLHAPQPAARNESSPGRSSGAVQTGASARSLSVPKPSLTPAAGTWIPSPAVGVPAVASAPLVGLRQIPAAARLHPDSTSADALSPTTIPGGAQSQALLLSAGERDELLAWIAAAPPTRWEGLLFAVLPDGLWIDRLAPGAAELPPLFSAERLSAHTGVIGSTLWLRSGAAWSPPLAVDILLERLAAQPSCDYVLHADAGGILRCRYVIERARLLPLDRAAVRTVLAAREPA